MEAHKRLQKLCSITFMFVTIGFNWKCIIWSLKNQVIIKILQFGQHIDHFFVQHWFVLWTSCLKLNIYHQYKYIYWVLIAMTSSKCFTYNSQMYLCFGGPVFPEALHDSCFQNFPCCLELIATLSTGVWSLNSMSSIRVSAFNLPLFFNCIFKSSTSSPIKSVYRLSRESIRIWTFETTLGNRRYDTCNMLQVKHELVSPS